jgi:hypothetical protein
MAPRSVTTRRISTDDRAVSRSAFAGAATSHPRFGTLFASVGGSSAGVGRLHYEDQAVRISVGVALTLVCLSLAGCSLFGKKNGDQAGNKPFLGSGSSSTSTPSGGTAAPVAESDNPPPGASGLLAGQVIDRSNRRPQKVYIQVVDLQDSREQPTAKLEVESQQDGYFVVQGLKPGKHYRLIARVKDGDHLMTGTTLAMPPNPRLSIVVSEENTTPSTPAVPDPPAVPGRAPSGGGDSGTAPTKPKESGSGGTPSSPTGAVPLPGSGTSGNPAWIADGPDAAFVPRSPDVDVKSQPPNFPQPPIPAKDGAIFPPVVAPVEPRGDNAGGPAPHPPALPTQIPSCVVVGKTVDNFALYDLDGQPWELRRNRTGRLVLLDIWTQPCAPCLVAFKYIEDLNRRYSRDGLEVVGIAYLRGSTAEQAEHARLVRARNSIRYKTLLGAGDSCPVRRKLAPYGYPTVLLLDEKGTILWSNTGFDEYVARQLETVIRNQLESR